jgi:hypothetical protein
LAALTDVREQEEEPGYLEGSLEIQRGSEHARCPRRARGFFVGGVKFDLFDVAPYFVERAQLGELTIAFLGLDRWFDYLGDVATKAREFLYQKRRKWLAHA